MKRGHHSATMSVLNVTSEDNMLSLTTCVIQTTHPVSLDNFYQDRKYKQQLLKEITAAACAMLNSNGGKVMINIECTNDNFESQISLLVCIFEQHLIPIIGVNITTNVNFEDKKTIIMFVKKADSLITVNYNLYLPSKTLVNPVPPSESQDRVREIFNRNDVEEPVLLKSHRKLFSKGKGCGFSETKTVQFKNLKADKSKRTTLADRMTGKGNKFSCYVSAFANHMGGHIYYGIDDDGVVAGERIPNELDKSIITTKVKKTINQMIWPEPPKQMVNWDISFEPVLDADSAPIPSTFVIVIFIAPCLGGVFTEEPECYEMVVGKMMKMSFARWKEIILRPIELFHKPITDSTVERSTWSSSETKQICNRADEQLMEAVNDGKSIENISNDLLKEHSDMTELKLLILAKNVIESYRSSSFQEARKILDEYETYLRTSSELWMFHAIRVYLVSAICTAEGDVEAVNNVLPEALAQAEVITRGRISAALYLLVAMNLLRQKRIDDNSAVTVYIYRALEDLKHVQDLLKIRVDMEHKAHILLAFFHLGCNEFGVPIKKEIDHKSLKNASSSVNKVYQSIQEGNLMSKYRKLQFKLVQSTFFYRKSQVEPDRKISFLETALKLCQKAEEKAIPLNFQDVVNCSRSCMALFC